MLRWKQHEETPLPPFCKLHAAAALAYSPAVFVGKVHSRRLPVPVQACGMYITATLCEGDEYRAPVHVRPAQPLAVQVYTVDGMGGRGGGGGDGSGG